MFLSHSALIKQLVHEFINWEPLALDPGITSQLKPQTLLGSTAKKSVDDIEQAQKSLIAAIDKIQSISDVEKKEFKKLLQSLVDYKTGAWTNNNPFASVANMTIGPAHPCAWPVFAPLIIASSGTIELSFPEKELNLFFEEPKVPVKFHTSCLLKDTGLYLAVETGNHEMVHVFFNKFFRYTNTPENLKELLTKAKDPQTRLALLENSPKLIEWLEYDHELQQKCVVSCEELTGLWSYFSDSQKKNFINWTQSSLWLNLLHEELGKEKVELLLGTDFFAELQSKLCNDELIQSNDLLSKTLNYLAPEQQFNYLLSEYLLSKTNNLKNLFPSVTPSNQTGWYNSTVNALFPPAPSRGKEWDCLLASLGYPKNQNNRLITTRYILPEEVATVHNALIEVVLSLPLDPEDIISTLQQIETYCKAPETQEAFKKHMTTIGDKAVNTHYETSNYIVEWFYKLLRFIQLIPKSPLTPHLAKLTQVIKSNPTVISGELLQILPPQENDNHYKKALSAYLKNNIALFWASLKEDDVQKKITRQPLRFAKLISFLSEDNRDTLFKALDKDSLEYFNSAEGLRQLVLATPQFDAHHHLPILQKAMRDKDMQFLGDDEETTKLLLDPNTKLYEAIRPFFPFITKNPKDLDHLDSEFYIFHRKILIKLPTPLKQDHYERFLRVYYSNSNVFASLMRSIEFEKLQGHIKGDFWKEVPKVIWTAEWKISEEWLTLLNSLKTEERLDFFDYLTSDGTLTIKEFCDFMYDFWKNGHNEFDLNELWSKVPQQQWEQWSRENNLPSSTYPLLKTMEFPLRTYYFHAMDKQKKADDQNLPIQSNRTVENFFPPEVILYLDEIKATMSTLMKENAYLKNENKQEEAVNAANAKLMGLIKEKRSDMEKNQKKLVENLNELIPLVNQLHTDLLQLDKLNLSDCDQWEPYIASFYKPNPSYDALNSLGILTYQIKSIFGEIKSNSFYINQDNCPDNIKEIITDLTSKINIVQQDLLRIETKGEPISQKGTTCFQNIKTILFPEAIEQNEHDRVNSLSRVG